MAELMRYCGQSVQMQYDCFSTSYISPMPSVFQYSPNNHLISRENYTAEEWDKIIYNELAAKRPVIYRGSKPSGGHAFVVDGYDGNGFFHINWGWEGFYDSYFLLSFAVPDMNWTSVPSDRGYWSEQAAIIGIQPAAPNEELLPLVSTFPSRSEYNYNRQSVDEPFENVWLYGDIGIKYNILPQSMPTIEYGWALYRDGLLIEMLTQASSELPEELSSFLWNDKTISFGAGLAEGAYHIRQVYRPAGQTEWNLCERDAIEIINAEITATTLKTWGNPNRTSFDFIDLSVTEQPGVGYPLTATVRLANTGDSKSFKVRLWYQKQGATTWTQADVSAFIADPGKSSEVALSFIPKETGTYNLKATKIDDEDPICTTTVNVAASEEITCDGITYLCTPDYKQARIVNSENGMRAKVLNIPQTVSASGTECKVIAIEDEALSYQWNVNTVIIPEGVERIGIKAFYSCDRLTKVVLPSSIREIGSLAFSQCRNLDILVSYIQNPPVIVNDVFKTENSYDFRNVVTHPNTTLYVPAGTKTAYEALEVWSQFSRIEEGDFVETIVDGLKYACSAGGTTATVVYDDSYNTIQKVSIPESVTISGKTYRVTRVGNLAFYDCFNITSMSLPEGIESIGNSAFRLVTLSECVLPSTLRIIGERAFEYVSNVTTMIVPEGVKCIGNYAFCNVGLHQLVLPSTLELMGWGLIGGNDNLMTVITNNANPSAITERVFNHEQRPLTLFVPKGTKSVYESLHGWSCFDEIEEGEPLEAMVGPLKYFIATTGTKATVIKDNSYMNLTEVEIPEKITVSGKSYSVTSIGASAFRRCRSITSISLPEGLQSIGKDAFSYMAISEIHLPSTLTSIGNGAFSSCNNIKEIVLPEGLETIGNNALSMMLSLDRVILPSTLKQIGNSIMSNDPNLTVVVSHIKDPFEVSEDVFYLNYEEPTLPASLYVPIGSKAAYERLPEWTKFASIVEGDNKLTYIIDGKEYKTCYIEFGSKIIPEQAPEKEGYTFSGWSEIPKTMPANDVTVTGTFIQTAIDAIRADGDSLRIYDLKGNHLGQTKSGVNIIRQADGKVRKVVVK